MDQASGKTPARLMRPKLGFHPTRPQSADGTRTEPPVSVPSEASAIPAATETAEPLLEPPGSRSGS